MTDPKRWLDSDDVADDVRGLLRNASRPRAMSAAERARHRSRIARLAAGTVAASTWLFSAKLWATLGAFVAIALPAAIVGRRWFGSGDRATAAVPVYVTASASPGSSRSARTVATPAPLPRSSAPPRSDDQPAQPTGVSPMANRAGSTAALPASRLEPGRVRDVALRRIESTEAPSVPARERVTRLADTPTVAFAPERSHEAARSNTAELTAAVPAGSPAAGAPQIERSAAPANAIEPDNNVGVRIGAGSGVSAVASQVASLADETRALVRAHAALRREPAAALALVQEMERAHANGQLLPERQFVAIQALRRLGRLDEARVRARRLIAAAPNSPQALEAARWIAAPER